MSAVEVCPDCDIAGCTHIRNRTGAFADLSQPSVQPQVTSTSVKYETIKHIPYTNTISQPSVTVEELADVLAVSCLNVEDNGNREVERKQAKAILAKYNVTVKE